MNLTDLSIGQKGIIEYIDEKCDNKLRLTELGFSSKTEIIPLHRSFSGSITAYFVKGAVMALRKSDARHIMVKCEGE
ncbi:MAG: ferrous iron transport protein A [Lachnospirales bacterium]